MTQFAEPEGPSREHDELPLPLGSRKGIFTIPLATVTIFLAVFIMIVPTGIVGPASGPGPAALGQSGSAASPMVSAGSQGTQLMQQAEASLLSGAGPAYGTHLSCSSASAYSSTTCAPATSATPLGWSPVGSPAGRESVNMVYDIADGYVVLFSGGSSSDVQGDTWIFQNGAWQELNLAVSPPPRDGAYMSYDTHDGYVVLFGGWGGYNGPYEYGDTWAFSGGLWHLMIAQNSCTGTSGSEPCPSARDSGVMADDVYDDYVVLFGGYGPLGDTWRYEAGKWAQIIPATECTWDNGTKACPEPRQDGVMAWDPALAEDILWGGENSSSYMNDTWAFKGGAWKELISSANCTAVTGSEPCPAGREEASLSFDTTNNELVLFGGYDGTTDFNDVWYFNGKWSYEASASDCQNCPIGRSGAGLANDPATGGILMFGGYPAFGDTWVLSKNIWTQVTLTGTPGSRWDASLAWDPGTGTVLLFGGFDGSALGDTWEFYNGVWTEVFSALACESTACPSARQGAALAWDGIDGYMVLFGGMTGAASGYLRDTWGFNGVNWTEVNAGTGCTATTCPTARANASMVWDDEINEAILFGGVGSSGYLNDTWAYYSGAWHEVLTATDCASEPCPSPRGSAGMATEGNPTSGVIVFGGETGSGYTNDTWQFSGGAWTELESAAKCTTSHNCPKARAGAAMTFDPVDDMIVLFGGMAASGNLSDTWTLTGSNWTSVKVYGPEGMGYSSLAAIGLTGNLLFVGGFSTYGGGQPGVWVIGTPFKVNGPYGQPSSTVDVGQQLTFSVVASGGGVTNYSYVWQGLPTGCIPPASGTSPSYSCIPSQSGVFNVTAVAEPSNGLAAETSTFLLVTVNPDPTVQLSLNGTPVTLGHNFTLTASASGGSGKFTYAWYGLPSDCPVSNTSSLTCDPMASTDVGTWQVYVSAIDSLGYNATSTMLPISIGVAPWSVVVTLSQSTVDLSEYVDLGALVQGFSGTPTFNWSGLPPGCAGTRGALLCLPTSTGTYPITVTASSTYAGTVTSAPTVLTVAPTFAGVTLTSSSSQLTEGSQLTLSSAINGGTGPYGYTWKGLPAGCLGSDEGVLSCYPSATGSYNISVKVQDTTSALVTSNSVTLVVSAPVQGSIVLSANPSGITLGSSTVLNATLVGWGVTPTLSWIGLPDGCTASGSSFTCTPASTGSFAIAVEASVAGVGSWVSNTVTLVVSSASSSGGNIVVSLSHPGIDLGQSTNISATTSGWSGSPTLNWVGLPTSCMASGTSFSCKPITAGTYYMDAEASMTGSAVVVSNTVTLTVSPALAQAAVLLSNNTLTLGQALSLSVTVEGGASPYTFAWSGLPGGCVAGSAAQLSCVPTSSGSYTIGITVTDANGMNVSGSASLQINQAPSSSQSASSTSNGPNWADYAILALVAIAVVLALVSLMMRPRRPEEEMRRGKSFSGPATQSPYAGKTMSSSSGSGSDQGGTNSSSPPATQSRSWSYQQPSQARTAPIAVGGYVAVPYRPTRAGASESDDEITA